MKQSIFRSAITGEDGAVDAGYLSLYWIMSVVITAIPFMCIFAMVAMILDATHKFDVQGLGIGIGSVCTGFGVAVGAVGAFRMGDKDRPQPPPLPGKTTTTEKTTEIVTPAATPAKPMPVEVINADPVPVDVVDEPKRKAKGKR